MPVQEHVIFEVGGWTVDSLAHTLTNGSTEHQIPPKSLAVLVFLAQNHGRLVTRGELIDAVWEGNAYVGDNALNNAIWRIRQVLGRDAGGTEFVKTVPKSGYQLSPTPRFLKTDDDWQLMLVDHKESFGTASGPGMERASAGLTIGDE